MAVGWDTGSAADGVLKAGLGAGRWVLGQEGGSWGSAHCGVG